MNRKEQIMDLWRLCFEDSEDFIQAFFTHIYQEKNVITIEENGGVISSLQLLPYSIHYHGKEIPAAYLYGVCTHPNYRKRGLMAKLLKKSFQEMERRGMELTFLLPAHDWLFDCYRKYGYTEIFDYEPFCYQVKEIKLTPITLQPIVQEIESEAWFYLDQQLKQYPISILHTKEDFHFLLQDIRRAGGENFIYKSQGEIRGLVLAIPMGNIVYLPEFQCDSIQIREEILQTILHIFSCDEIRYRSTPHQNRKHLGMARIVHPKQLYSIWQQQTGNQISPEQFTQLPHQEQTRLLLNYPKENSYLSLMMD